MAEAVLASSEHQLWEHVVPGVSQWLRDRSELQSKVCALSGSADSAASLAALLSPGSADPCQLGDFAPEEEGGVPDEVEALLAEACSAKENMKAEDAAAACIFDSQVTCCAALDLPAEARVLDSLRGATLADITSLAKKLAEIVSPDSNERKGFHEILCSEHGSEEVNKWKQSERHEAFKAILRGCTVHREESTLQAASGFIQTSEPLRAALDCQKQILARKESDGKDLELQLARASEVKQEADRKVARLQQRLDARTASQVKCKERERAVIQKVAEARSVLKQRWQEFQQADAAYSSAYIQREVLRVGEMALRETTEALGALLAKARATSQQVHAGCQEWRQRAEQSAAERLSLGEGAAREAARLAQPALRAKALDTCVAQELLGLLLEDTRRERQFLEAKRVENEQQALALDRQMGGGAPDRAPDREAREVTELAEELAKRQDLRRDLEAQLARAGAREDNIAGLLRLAAAQLQQLADLGGSGPSLDLLEDSKQMAKQAYQPALKLWELGRPVAPAPTGPAALQVALPDLEALVRGLFHGMLQQVRADMLFRGPGSPEPAEPAEAAEASPADEPEGPGAPREEAGASEPPGKRRRSSLWGGLWPSA